VAGRTLEEARQRACAKYPDVPESDITLSQGAPLCPAVRVRLRPWSADRWRA